MKVEFPGMLIRIASNHLGLLNRDEKIKFTENHKTFALEKL